MNAVLGCYLMFGFLFFGCAILVFVLLLAEYKELKAKVNNQK